MEMLKNVLRSQRVMSGGIQQYLVNLKYTTLQYIFVIMSAKGQQIVFLRAVFLQMQIADENYEGITNTGYENLFREKRNFLEAISLGRESTV